MLNSPFRRTIAVAAAALLALPALASCAADAPSTGKLDVVAGFYPLQFVAEQVGDGRVSVTNLVPPGTEPHDLELSPSQVAQVAGADLVLHIKGFQPELDEATAQNAADRSLDAASAVPLVPGSAHEHGEEHEEEHEDEHEDEQTGLDPHVWLDPIRLATIGDAVAERLAEVDATNADAYTAAAQRLRTALTTLDGEFTDGLKTCRRRQIITSHAAFGYLAERYGLEQIALTGLSPEAEPTPQRLAEVVTAAKEHQATTIFFETLVSPKVAETLATEVGAKTAVLDPLEGLPPGSTGDYFSVMRANLETLRSALSCA